ncbi:PEP-CTERM sorting domain-containing protein [Thauera sinica]|nr:PEP-CTERM sorting domain-containing protein [Thauera sp. K11]ATE60129.1 hypothetical protein CCZ27_09350 [Thauera sp. K11]
MLPTTLKKLGAAAVLVAALAAPASAAVLVQQRPADGGPGFLSANSVGYQNGDTFVLGGDSELQGIAWWGTEAGPDGFVVRLFDSLAGGAAPLVTYLGAVNRELADPAIHDDGQNPLYRYWIDGLSFSLAGGITYLLSVGNEDAEWFWQTGLPDGSSHWRGDDGDDWTEDAFDLAFAIDGQRTSVNPVPEPGVLALLGIAGLAAALAGRRRKATA